jgi:tetratricopeptide (TPR) repeat protein
MVICHLLERFGDDSSVPSIADEAISIARGLGDDAIVSDALSQLSWFRFQHGDLPAALAQIDEAVGLARTTGDPRLIAWILGRRAVFEAEGGDLDAAFADQEETLALSRATGDNYRLATTLANLGIDELAAGELRAARAHLQEASMLADSLGYQNLSAGLRQNLGFVDIIDADPREARRHFIDSLDTARITGVKSYVHGALLGLALAAGADDDPTVAATLHGVADKQSEQAGRAVEALEAGLRQRDHTQLRATLGDAFDAAYQHGRTLSQADAIALAVKDKPGKPAPAIATTAAGRPADSGRFSWRAVGAGTRDRGPGGGRGHRRPDRRAALPVGQHREIASGAHPGQDRRPPAHRAGPLRHPGRYRIGGPFRLRTGPPWPDLGQVSFRAINGADRPTWTFEPVPRAARRRVARPAAATAAGLSLSTDMCSGRTHARSW